MEADMKVLIVAEGLLVVDAIRMYLLFQNPLKMEIVVESDEKALLSTLEKEEMGFDLAILDSNIARRAGEDFSADLALLHGCRVHVFQERITIAEFRTKIYLPIDLQVGIPPLP